MLFIIKQVAYIENRIVDFAIVTHPDSTREEFENLCRHYKHEGCSPAEIASQLQHHGFVSVPMYSI
jgi:hypothetical protein